MNFSGLQNNALGSSLGESTLPVVYDEEISNILPYIGPNNDWTITRSNIYYNSYVFDPGYYLLRNPDVKRNYSVTNAKEHWLNYGINEKRVSSLVFDLNYYVANNLDLREAYGDRWNEYIWHWVTYGIKEGRRGSKSFNPVGYFNSFGEGYFARGDYAAAIKHWLTIGIKTDIDRPIGIAAMPPPDVYQAKPQISAMPPPDVYIATQQKEAMPPPDVYIATQQQRKTVPVVSPLTLKTEAIEKKKKFPYVKVAIGILAAIGIINLVQGGRS